MKVKRVYTVEIIIETDNDGKKDEHRAYVSNRIDLPHTIISESVWGIID